MINILMYGFSGHIIKPWLDYFTNHSSQYSLTFVCPSFEINSIHKSSYPNIHIIETSPPLWVKRVRGLTHLYNVWLYIKYIILAKYDITIIQGLYSPQSVVKLLKFTYSKYIILYLWNSWSQKALHANTNHNSTKKFATMMKYVDAVVSTWEPTILEFKSLFPEFSHLCKDSFPLGLTQDEMNFAHAPARKFSAHFLSSIADQDILCFWARTIKPANRHDVLFHAIELLNKTMSYSDIKYLIMGGKASSQYALSLISLYSSMYLPNTSFIHDMFVESDNLYSLYNRANIFINLSDNDQLSKAILEALSRNCITILSDIPEYRILSSLGFHIFFTKNTPFSVAMTMKKAVNFLTSPKLNSSLWINSLLIRYYFDFNTNIKEFLVSIPNLNHSRNESVKREK